MKENLRLFQLLINKTHSNSNKKKKVILHSPKVNNNIGVINNSIELGLKVFSICLTTIYHRNTKPVKKANLSKKLQSTEVSASKLPKK